MCLILFVSLSSLRGSGLFFWNYWVRNGLVIVHLALKTLAQCSALFCFSLPLECKDMGKPSRLVSYVRVCAVLLFFWGGFSCPFLCLFLKEIKIRCNRTQHTTHTHAPADVFPSFSRPFFAAFLVGCFSPLNITPLQSHFDSFRLAVWRGTWLPLSLRSLRDYSEPLRRFLFFVGSCRRLRFVSFDFCLFILCFLLVLFLFIVCG